MSIHSQMAMGGSTTFSFSRGSVTTAGVVIVAGVLAQLFAPDLVDTLRAHWFLTVLAVVAGFSLISYLRLQLESNRKPSLPKMFTPIPFTEEDLAWYDGARNSTAARVARGDTKPEEYSDKTIASSALSSSSSSSSSLRHPLPMYDNLVFVAVKGVVYNVSPEYYGPGAGYSAFAAKDSSRQLGKVVVGTDECNSDWTTMNEKHRKVLDDWEARYRDKYSIVGWVVPSPESYWRKGEQFAP